MYICRYCVYKITKTDPMFISDQKILQEIKRKQSPANSAQRLGISEEEYIQRRSEVVKKFGGYRNILELDEMEITLETAEYIEALQNKLIENINLEKGTGSYSGLISDKPLSPEEIEEKYHIDKTKWRLSSYWNKEQANGKFLVSANVTQLRSDVIDQEVFQNQFTEFLSKYSPKSTPIEYLPGSLKEEDVCIVLPRQDLHWNKYDILGKNNIHHRFEVVNKSTMKMVDKIAANYNIDEITYVVGSDMANSEYTSTTTKGTPQVNILTYEGSFIEICNNEVTTLSLLLSRAKKIKVQYIPGNHDRFVGWHIITWLQAYFRDEKRVSFDTSILNRKYLKYGNSAIMLNHGDVLKPAELSHKFPIEFKEEWSKCEHYYIFTGDKHHKKSFDFHGIQFFQVPQLSGARSYWDDQQGHTCSKPEMTAFVITRENGLCDLASEPLKL